jgi:hypothetical protein
VFDRFAVLEVLSYYPGHVIFCNAEVPGTARVDDDVWAVFTEAQAVHGVYADVPVYVLCP